MYYMIYFKINVFVVCEQCNTNLLIALYLEYKFLLIIL